MAYSTLDDILLNMDETELIQLTDDSGSEVVDSDTVLRAISDADRLIDVYLGSRYRLPMESVPDLIRTMSVDLSIFNLFSRRGAVPDIRKDRHALTLQTLDKLAAGKITIDARENHEAATRHVKASRSQGDRLITRQTLERM